MSERRHWRPREQDNLGGEAGAAPPIQQQGRRSHFIVFREQRKPENMAGGRAARGHGPQKGQRRPRPDHPHPFLSRRCPNLPPPREHRPKGGNSQQRHQLHLHQPQPYRRRLTVPFGADNSSTKVSLTATSSPFTNGRQTLHTATKWRRARIFWKAKGVTKAGHAQ